jgi:hypothetical protein
MTKLRKLTALLLTGALTLLLLTACSGGGGSSGPEAQAEAEVMRAINNDRANGRAAPLSNDPDMQRIAKKKLANTNLDADLNGSIGRYKFYHDVKYDEKTSTLTLIAQYDYQNTKLEDLIGCITENNKASNLNFNHSSNWTKVGVAAKIHQGQTYIAITLQVKTT